MPFTADTARAAQLKGAEIRRLTSDSHTNGRLATVRKQLDALDKRMDEQLVKEPLDPLAIDQISRALGRLAEIERQLAGRPMPGSLRPRQAKDERRRGGKSDLSDAG